MLRLKSSNWMVGEMTRAERRARAETVKNRRVRLARAVSPGWEITDAMKGAWRKRSPFSCGCSKRQHGRPRTDDGMCCGGERRRIYRWRNEGRELCLDATRRHEVG